MTPAALARHLPSLAKGEWRRVCAKVGLGEDDPAAVLAVALADWLAHLGVGEGARLDAVGKAWPSLSSRQAGGRDLVVVVRDYRWFVTPEFTTGCLDLEEGVVVPLPPKSVTTTVCDLTELVRRLRAAGGGKDADVAAAAGPPGLRHPQAGGPPPGL